MNGKYLGATFLVAGTAIGAGMLALPIACGNTGLTPSLLLLISIWCIMLYSAFLVLEVNLTLELEHNSFSSMAYKTLGRPAQIIAWICMLLLLYSLTAAYISGNASILQLLFQTLWHITIPHWINALGFLLIFGTIVTWSTRCVDLINRIFFSIKGIALIITLGLLLPETEWSQLSHNHITTNSLFIAPIFITAFAFHTVIPSLTTYIGKHVNTLRLILLCGGSFPLFIYIVWLMTTLGIIPQTGPNSFTNIHNHHDSVSQFLSNLITLTPSPWIHIGIHSFANIAMVTSFLGVTLGLFDFLADGFKRPNHLKGRIQTSLLTFIPPLIFALLYPQGFILALECAAIFVAILEMILPACMAYKTRQHDREGNNYRVFGGKIGLNITILSGVIIITLEILRLSGVGN